MALPRIHFPHALTLGEELDLPAAASRHIQVLRMQPGESVCLFPGAEPNSNQEYTADIVAISRQTVRVRVLNAEEHSREIPTRVHLVVGMPSNERMDWLVEKATELGVYSISPVMTERSVLRLKGERADKKREHWQAIATAACEQSGRNTVPIIHPVQSLDGFLKNESYRVLQADTTPQPPADRTTSLRCILSLRTGTQTLANRLHSQHPAANMCFVSGPEGGLSATEEEALIAHGFLATTLGARVLRAETAPLAVLAHIALTPAD
ncbi:16S rRNA (uracil(1498)-N(3))-methyltransferase [Lampropedia puyangensis]|uniref:Ribosomal RNA small subunit methyltransferase E n=1 Tax=Lampropedia puyangensis TaxID=1330072 RepID=A0A4S8FDT7_9BURK|nr:16S rRNA (uracil(1498)-N(3))-methyltransferase [Lampropedia puyangensis]THU05409.1 16S rRNA (uracil(1498)-N(3))-methyltransferase [Lampropedia puyangensis]